MPRLPALRTLLVAVFVAAALTILNLALWVQYRNTRRDLTAELARRLENVAMALGSLLDSEQLVDAWLEQQSAGNAADSLGALPDSVAGAGDALTATARSILLRAQLAKIVAMTNLANITLYDPDGRPFLDAVSGAQPIDDPLDHPGVLAALTGNAAHTPLYRSGSEYFMSGYAPVPRRELPFAVGVEADARFFAGLRTVRGSLFAVGAFSVLGLVAAGLFFARLQSRLARAETAMQRAETLASMGRMTAGIAHEIRNPLGIIRATAARLKKRYDDPARPDERFDFIAEEVDRLNAVLSGYLGFARDEPPQMEKLDLVPLLERAFRLMQPELENPPVRLEMDLAAPCSIQGDRQRLQQVVMNLVLNSAQAMPEGGTLHVRLRVENGQACLTFADTGPGIPPSLRERVFEPFFTTREKGSGLGLTVVRRIVEEHGGSIGLDTGTGGGARVDIRLPLA